MANVQPKILKKQVNKKSCIIKLKCATTTTKRKKRTNKQERKEIKKRGRTTTLTLKELDFCTEAAFLFLRDIIGVETTTSLNSAMLSCGHDTHTTHTMPCTGCQYTWRAYHMGTTGQYTAHTHTYIHTCQGIKARTVITR